MSCLIKMCLDGDSKSYEYNRAYIDICVYDNEIISFPDLINSINTHIDHTQIEIDPTLVKTYELLTENARIKTKKKPKQLNFNLDPENCKLILYPNGKVTYKDREIDCYAVLIWHIDRDTLRIIDRSCRF